MNAELITRHMAKLRQLSRQGDRVRDAEHDARLWRLSGAPGFVEDQPVALDVRAEGHTVQSLAEMD
jgi:hypothetical protein